MTRRPDDTTTDLPIELDDAAVFEGVRRFFEEEIPFNRVLGLLFH